jgi:hypothetical protein
MARERAANIPHSISPAACRSSILSSPMVCMADRLEGGGGKAEGNDEVASKVLTSASRDPRRGGDEYIGKQRQLQESPDLPSKLQVRALLGDRSYLLSSRHCRTQNRRATARAQAVCIHLDDGTAKQDEGIIKLPTKKTGPAVEREYQR